jgi:hypothetical protein
MDSGNYPESDSQQFDYPDYGASLHTVPFPMQSYNNAEGYKANRRAPGCDTDLLPHQFRQYVNASGALDVQIGNGLRNGVANGLRIPYLGTGWLFTVEPRIPGQQRGDVAGFHARGPSPLNYQNMWQAGPGSQPSNPGGPGKIAAVQFVNPMTG